MPPPMGPPPEGKPPTSEELLSQYDTNGDGTLPQNKMRRELLSNVSHKLKTLVFLIQGYAEGLKTNIAEENMSRLSVYNSGTPIPEEDIHKIWTSFYKVDPINLIRRHEINRNRHFNFTVLYNCLYELLQ